MRKKTIALAAASLTACTFASAQAQSSVTLYGIVDTGVVYINNKDGSRSTELRGGNKFSSRLGVRGVEDLGGGLNALFDLEAGIGTDTGVTYTPFFNRHAWVGLRSNSLGEIKLGRMLPILTDVFLMSLQALYLGNPTAAVDGAATAAGSSLARFNNMLGGTRVNNAIKYQSPSLSGFRIHAMAALDEKAVQASSPSGRIGSLGGSYSGRHFDAGLVYHEQSCAKSETAASGCMLNGKAKHKILGAGAAYKRNGARYDITYTRQHNALNVKDRDADTLSLMARYPLNTQWVAVAGFQYLNDKTAANQDVRQYNLAVNYLVSVRTQLYAMYSRQSVSNGGQAGMYSVLSSDSKQNQVSLGMLHAF